MSIFYSQAHRTFTLTGGDVSYVLYVTDDGRLMNLYWGKKLPDDSLQSTLADYPAFVSFDLPALWYPWELPTLSGGWYGTPALDIANAQGNQIVDLRVQGHRIYDGKQPLEGLPATYVESAEEAQTLEIDLADAVIGLQVTACFTVFAKGGALAKSMRLTNAGEQPLSIEGLLSASVPLWGNAYDVVHLKGAWARERSTVRTALGEAEYRIFSQRGASGHEENPFLALCGRNTDEHQGDVWGVNLIYSGSFQASAYVDNANNTRLSIGLNSQVFRWNLTPGQSFQSPEAVLVYSAQGFNGLSQIYHTLYRTRLARGVWRDRVRPILVNNWEATYFDFTEEKILAIARQASEVGIELFVLDDGWFGKRNSDNCSLGDWVVNRQKLPDGLGGLGKKIHALGLLFGLWVEPEMISPDSNLYRSHPDWCLHAPNRPRTEERNQLILDLAREDVQAYVVDAISRVIEESGVDYIKWDMNRNMTESHSAAIPAERQGEVQHRYMLGLYHILETIVSRFPNVLFESCSGGGGRFDGGMLYYMPQAWTSDNTDAVSRLDIQYGTSLVYPISSMGAHVSAIPNHQCGRTPSLEMRWSVALGGNFGFELDITKMSTEELKAVRQLTEKVKQYRALTQQGTFYRLLPPSSKRCAAWAFVSPDRKEALLCVYQILCVANLPPVRVRLEGLASGCLYEDEEHRVFSADVLMNMGMSVFLSGDFDSKVIHLKALE